MKPFLKWAGGKYKLVNEILQHLPKSKRLVEPFVGAGALFLNTDFEEYWINDINPDLVNVYEQLKLGENKFIDYCEGLFSKKDEDTYYKRREEFNKTKNKLRKASLFVWLNRNGFNGLCRYNLSGEFNVPFGKYKTIYFPRDEMVASIDRLSKTIITNLDFEEVIKGCRKSDAIYCDPPYVPVNDTSSFTSYFGSFGDEEQQRLANACIGKDAVISNSYCEKSLKIFGNAKINVIEVRRNISCKDRKKVQEIIATYESK